MTKNKYKRYGIQIPEIVQQAIELARERNFPVMPEGRPVGFSGPASACIPEVWRLLRSLAASCRGGRIGEHGTGCGVGTSWMASGMSPATRLVSAELNRELVQAVAELLRDYPNVEIRAGDCMTILADVEPFDLLFRDATPRQYLAPENWDTITEMVRVGGQIVFDDLAPVDMWPPQWDDLVDLKREFAFHNPRVIGSEVRTTATQAALIVTRIS
jgi:predicted O-methyltransferase YrrM